MDSVPIWVVEVQDGEAATKTFLGADEIVTLKRLPIDKLKENLHEVCNAMVGIFDDVNSIGQFQLKEVTVQVEISAEAGVNLIGTGKVGGTGAITLKFAR